MVVRYRFLSIRTIQCHMGADLAPTPWKLGWTGPDCSFSLLCSDLYGAQEIQYGTLGILAGRCCTQQREDSCECP